MSTLSITLSANAGISLTLGGSKIWIDALHGRKFPGFSTLDETLQLRIQQNPAFLNPAAICFTHCHEDHYSKEMTQWMAARWPEARLFLPQQDFTGQTLLCGEDVRETVGSLDLHFFRTNHDGKSYAGVPHYALLLSSGNTRILISGDTALAEPRLAEIAREAPIDVAILNFPWITLQRSRDFLESYVKPQHLLIYHLPFPKDDLYGYLTATKKCASQTNVPDIRILDTPLQTEEICLDDIGLR